MKHQFITGLFAAAMAVSVAIPAVSAAAPAPAKKPLTTAEYNARISEAKSKETTAQMIEAIKAILEKETLSGNDQYNAIKTMFQLTQKEPALRKQIYDYLKAKRTQGKPGQMFDFYRTARSVSGNAVWFDRGYYNPGSYERWRECTDLMLKDIEPIENKSRYADFYKDNASIAYAYGDFKFAREQLDLAMSFGYKTQFSGTATTLYLYAKDHDALSRIVKEERKLKNYDRDTDLYWRALEYFDRGGTAKDFDSKFQKSPSDLALIPNTLSDTWTVFTTEKSFNQKQVKALNGLKEIPTAEVEGLKPQQMKMVNGLITLPKAPARTPAYLFQEFEAPEDGLMQAGFGADHYFEVVVNGKSVINRLHSNDNPDQVSASNFAVNIPVKKGKNFIRVQVLAGKEGFAFACGKADTSFTSTAKMLLLRRISAACITAKRYDICRDIYSHILGDMFISLKPLVYNVKFDADAPRTADGFTYSKYYNDWDNMVTEFRPYGDTLNTDNKTDISRFLKDTPKPQVPEEWKTGIFGLWNTEGLHIYVRCCDPGAQDILDGKRGGGMLECTFRPADDVPFNMFFFENLPDTYDSINIDFASPSPRYSRTNDVIFRDAVANKDGVTAHIFIPWAGFCNNLPINGKVWYLGMQRWSNGGGFSISGSVHELGRMLNLKMDITPAQLKELKRKVCINAFNRYTNFINTIEFKSWKDDKDLGDPAFYEAELEALVKELSDAGAKLSDPNADVDAIFDTYVKQWSTFSYIVAAKRRDYLKRTMFE